MVIVGCLLLVGRNLLSGWWRGLKFWSSRRLLYWFGLEGRLGRGFGWFWGAERLFAVVWLLGVELGEVLGSFSRAGEVVVIGAVEVFVVSVNRNKRKTKQETNHHRGQYRAQP